MSDMHIEELIVRSARGEASAAEERRLALWRERSPRNEGEYQALRRLVLHAAKTEPEIRTTPVTAAEVIRRAERADRVPAGGRATARSGDPDRPKSPHLPSWSWNRRAVLLRVAAAVALLAVGLAVADRLRHPGAEQVVQRLEYQTEEAGKSIQLEDGTLVHLGPSSRLEVALAEPAPRLWLEGRAFFGVPPQESAPLVIGTPAGQVNILGTRLEVRSGRDDLRVLVVDGRVSISVGPENTAVVPEEIEVEAGKMSIVRRGEAPTLVPVEDPLPHLEWMGQAMVFQATPLDRVFPEIERRFGAEIRLLDPTLAGRTLTTSFDGQTFPEVMRIVCRVVHVRCLIEEDRATVTSPDTREGE